MSLSSYKNIFTAFFILNIFNTTITKGQFVKPEMRAVWVATIGNIDWPDNPTTDTTLLKDSYVRLLEKHRQMGINTMIVQIRPAADAFFPSPYEPWSQWLTGKQGRAPMASFDILKFMITETHKRNMEFHAWLNPYRAIPNTTSCSIDNKHITKTCPEWFVKYGTIKLFDPGNKEAQEYVVNVVKDIVTRYDVDAIHFDDYFYPYPIDGKPFPDQITYKKYGNGMDLSSWRRSNVDSIILKLHAAIKKINPNCEFGISPFGVWRNIDRDPRGSRTKAGPTNYDYLYADILLWLKNGWIDYVAPQLYWEFGHKAADFETLVDWWSSNTFGRKLYIGLAPYNAGMNAAWKDKTQLPRQIEKVRNTPNIQGMIFFSSKSLENNLNGWGDSLRVNYFKTPAATPRSK